MVTTLRIFLVGLGQPLCFCISPSKSPYSHLGAGLSSTVEGGGGARGRPSIGGTPRCSLAMSSEGTGAGYFVKGTFRPLSGMNGDNLEGYWVCPEKKFNSECPGILVLGDVFGPGELSNIKWCDSLSVSLHLHFSTLCFVIPPALHDPWGLALTTLYIFRREGLLSWPRICSEGFRGTKRNSEARRDLPPSMKSGEPRTRPSE